MIYVSYHRNIFQCGAHLSSIMGQLSSRSNVLTSTADPIFKFDRGFSNSIVFLLMTYYNEINSLKTFFLDLLKSRAIA